MWKKLPRKNLAILIVIGLVLIGMATGVVSLVVYCLQEPEWNPVFGSDNEVVGVWSDKNRELDLQADHQFSYHDHGVAFSGVWSRDDWNLYLRPGAARSNYSARDFRFVIYRGHYRVLTSNTGPDTWNHDSGLAKE